MQVVRGVKPSSRNKVLLVMGVFFGAFCALAAPGGGGAYADSLDYSVQIRPSLNITVSSSTVQLLLNPSTTPFGKADLTVSVGTNNFTGYKLYMKSLNDATDLVNSAFSTPTVIETLSSSTTEANFISDATLANKWGYRVTSADNTGADSDITSTTDFFPFVSGAKKIGSASSAVNNSTTTLTFASKVNYEKPAGLYSLDFNFNAIPIVTTSTFQDLIEHPEICTSEPTIITDVRDGQAYTIQRLPWKRFEADGTTVAESGTKCWMLDNLRLDISDPAVQARLSNQNTNASNTTLGYLVNGGGTSPYTTAAVSDAWTSSSQNSYNLPYIKVSGDKDGGGTWTRDTVPSRKYGDATGKVGVYYNYCAASAGSYCYASGAGTGNATEDVCPAGWSLPTGGASGDFQYLCSAYKGSACENPDSSTGALSMRNALSTPLSGHFNRGLAYYQGDGAYFWSSTYGSGTYMYNLHVTSGTVNPQNTNYRYYGFSVRCVLK